MKLFKYIFWITLGIILIVVVANLTGLTTKGIDFQTLEEHESFLSNYVFWSMVTTYTSVIALLNLIFGGVVFLVRGIRNQASRRKDILVGILLIIFPIALGLCYLALISMQSVHLKNPALGVKTYTNNNFGYEIKYPTSYTLDEVNNPVIESSTRDIAEIIASQVKIGIIANKNRNSIDDECRDVSTYAPSKEIGENTFNVIVSETATTDMGNPDNVHRYYYLKTQNSCYLILATYPPSLPQITKDAYNSQIENIISMFRVK